MKLTFILLASALFVAAQAVPEPISGLDTLRASGRSLGEIFDEMRDIIHEQHEQVHSLASDYWQRVKEVLAQHKEKRLTFAKKLLDNFNTFSKETLEKALNVLQPYRDQLGELFQKLQDKFNARFAPSTEAKETRSLREERRSLHDLFDQIKDILAEQRDGWSEYFGKKWDAFDRRLRKSAEARLYFIRRVLARFDSLSQQTLERVLRVLQPFQDEFDFLWRELNNKFQAKFGKSHSLVRRSILDRERSLGDLLDDMRDIIHDRRERLTTSIGDRWQDLKDRLARRRERRVAFAQKVLARFDTYNKETLEKIMSILEPFKNDLGTLHTQLQDRFNARFGRLTSATTESILDELDELAM